MADDPELKEAYANLAVSCFVLGDCDGAMRAYRTAKEKGASVLPAFEKDLKSEMRKGRLGTSASLHDIGDRNTGKEYGYGIETRCDSGGAGRHRALCPGDGGRQCCLLLGTDPVESHHRRSLGGDDRGAD
ncbi:MAG: hypothetical protein MZV63_30720 [Marinilabiliales bacterium]|nr:hypothetical protein [Marinilabiliales bacterium]